jgi:hypothetical protein
MFIAAVRENVAHLLMPPLTLRADNTTAVRFHLE